MEELSDSRLVGLAKTGDVEAFAELALEQQAKFLIFFQDFNQYLREKLQEARQQAPRKRPPDNQR